MPGHGSLSQKSHIFSSSLEGFLKNGEYNDKDETDKSKGTVSWSWLVVLTSEPEHLSSEEHLSWAMWGRKERPLWGTCSVLGALTGTLHTLSLMWVGCDISIFHLIKQARG